MTLTINKPIAVRDVFVPGGFPRYTYQSRERYGVEANLNDAIARLPKFIAVAGATKSGKTVLVRKNVPSNQCVWIDGGHVASIADVWDLILADLDIPSSVVETSTDQSESSSSFEIETAVKPGGVGGGTKNLDNSKTSETSGRATTFSVTGPKAAISALKSAGKILVVDDFHYLSEEIQVGLIRALKPAVFDGLQVVLMLIPHRMHQAAQAEMDVDGRTHVIPIPEWEADELFSIADTGFRTLNLELDADTINRLVSECFSSPHIMQDFCSGVCAANSIVKEHTGVPAVLVIGMKVEPEIFFRSFAQSMSPEAFKALRKGPERTNRKPRELTSGGSVDTYEAVLLALHELGGVTPVDWAKMRRALVALLKEVPQQHEVTRALENMDGIAKDRPGEPVIDYVQGELHLVDPFFRFYLKWNSSIRDSL